MRSATFTTYINAQVDPALESAFARQTSLATASYAKITQAAQEATRATAGLLGGKGTAGITSTTRALDQQTASTRASTTAAADNARQAARTADAMQRQGTAVRTAAQSHATLARSLTTTATSLAVVEGRLSPLAGRLISVSRAAEQLTGFQLGLAGVGAVLYSLGKAGNEYANLSSRIRPFFESQTDANKAMEDIIGIAQRSRTALEPIIEIYSRLKSNTDQLGISQDRIGRITEIASKAATLSGGTKEARTGALVQFSQAIGANFRGSGQEFQSLQEGAPLLLKAIADGYKNVDGSIGTSISNLRKLGQQGALTSKDVADALERSSVKIDKQFSTLPQTLSTAGTAFGNSLTVLVGRFDQSVGLTRTLADSIIIIANNLRVVVALAAGAATAFAAVKLGGIAQAAAANISALVAQRAAVAEMDAAWVNDARVTANAYTSALSGLLQEREAIRLNILEIARKAEAQAAAAEAAIAAQRSVAAAAAETVVASRYSGFATNPASGIRQTTTQAQNALEAETANIYKVQAVAANEAAASKLRLAAANEALSATNVEIAATTTAAAAAVGTLEVATANVAGRTTALGGVFSKIVGFLGGGWTIAFAAAATAVYLLATAESSAEKATRLHEDAQRSFASIVDRTTGKIYDQVDALQKLDVAKKSQASEEDSRKQFGQSRAQLIELVRNYTRPIDDKQYAALSGDGTPLPASVLNSIRKAPTGGAAQELDRLVNAFESNAPGAYKALTDGVVRLAPKIDGLAKALPSITDAGKSVRSSYDTNRQARAQQRILSGRAQDGDAALARGEQPQTSTGGGAAAKPRTRAQLNAAADALSATSDLGKARAALEKIRADGKDAAETEDAYIQRLSAAKDAVKSAEQAEKDLRKQRSAGAADARKDASNAKTEALQAAVAKKDTALASLYEQGLSPQSETYKKQRDAILNTYDSEVAKIRGLKNEHTALAAAAEADAKATAAYVVKQGEARRDILANYDETPRAGDLAKTRIGKLQDAVGTVFNGVVDATADNPLGKGLYTQAIADADARRINEGVRKPLADANREAARGVEIAKATLLGHTEEAEALRRAFQFRDQGINVSREDYRQILLNVQQEERLNDVLASRQRITSLITGAVDQARDGFEQLIVDLPTKGAGAGVDFLRGFQQSVLKLSARQLTEKVFAGADAKVRSLLNGTSSVDEAVGRYSTSVDNISTATSRNKAAIDTLSGSFEDAAKRFDQVQSGGGAAAPITGSAATADQSLISLLKKGNGVTGPDMDTPLPGEVEVRGQRKAQQALALPTSVTPSAKQVYSVIGESLFGGLDKLVNKVTGAKTTTDAAGVVTGGSKFFKGVGDAFGSALQGAGQGAIASGFAKALGIKQSGTGAAIGGALGGLTGIPGLGFVGGLLGGTLGGLLQKPKYGSASVSLNQYGEAVGGTGTGNSGSVAKAATGSAKSVADGINQIAQQLGATITNLPGVTIGTFDGKARVATTSTSQSLNYNNFNDSTLKDFGKDGEQDAIEYAIRYSISHAVINGISQASKNIIASGQDLTQAINKAVVIESIPKRLLQLTDPVKYAVSNLNDEFSQMISYLKEGGASAQQFADAQKLYDLERADAVKQATSEAASAIDQFLKDMVGSASSPLNKKTTYDNAAAALNAFKSDIAAGKTVNQDDLLNASRNFEDASKALNGSSQAFFSDFDSLRALLGQAKDNATATVSDGSTLPASPFASDKTVQDAIASLQNAQTGATQSQTDVLSNKLDQVVSAITDLGSSSGSSAVSSKSSLSLLPGSKFAQTAS